MRCPPDINETSVRKAIAIHAEGPLQESAWPCDVIGIHAKLIDQHNQFGLARGFPVEEKFSRPDPNPKTLETLLWQDFDFMASTTPGFQGLANRYILAEIHAPRPSANCLSLESRSRTIHVICFKSPLIHLINSAFSKILVLNHDERTADCLPEHEHILRDRAYSDTRLLAAFFNDMEVLFDQERLYLPFNPPHMAFPYDYCEQAESARRFILAHEIAHTLFPQSKMAAELATLYGTNSDEDRRERAWTEELWCDRIALIALLNPFQHAPLTEPQQYGLQNVIIGVLTLLTLIDIIEIILSRLVGPSVTHPPAGLRRDLIRKMIKDAPLYETTPHLKNILTARWRRLNSFQQFVSGANTPIVSPNRHMWSYTEFRDLLTPFGKSASQALFDATVAESQVSFNSDPEKQMADQHYF